VRYLLAGIVVTLVSLWPLGWAGLLLLVPAVLVATLLAPVRYRALAYAWDGGILLARAGVWTRRLWVVPVDKVQTAAVTRGPVQRFLGLGTLTVETAGSSGLRHIEVLDLGREDAERLLEQLSLVAGDNQMPTPMKEGEGH
jgi:uncharacterized membrane protein YdbT with pleckstrin-like domain